MEVIQETDRKWWIVDVPGSEDCGPYDTKAEADGDRRGIARYFKYRNRPGFFTVYPPPVARQTG